MNIMVFLLILIIGLPVLEIYFLIEVGSIFGAIPTIGMIVFTAVAGIALIRIQGLQTVQKAMLISFLPYKIALYPCTPMKYLKLLL